MEELLQEKDIKLQERESVIANWIQNYKDLDSQLTNRTDELAKQAKAFLDNGKLEEAERLLKQAPEKSLKNADAKAFSLAQIKVLQLNYPEAKSYYEKAVQVDSEKAIYLNELGRSVDTFKGKTIQLDNFAMEIAKVRVDDIFENEIKHKIDLCRKLYRTDQVVTLNKRATIFRES